MKAVVVRSPGDICWQDVPDLDPPPGWVKVAVKAVGICSSDISRALSNHAYHYPIVLGHEISGIVVAVGDNVESQLIGMRVAVSPLIPCGHCEWCENGRYSMCDHYDYLGSRRDGGCAEYVNAPRRNLVPIPASLSTEDASVLEPASVTLHGLDHRVGANDDVVILGAGNLGLFALQQAHILGAGRVFAVDPVTYRLEVAQSLGAIPVKPENDDGSHTINAITAGRGADLVIDTCGVASVQANALSMVRKGGRIVFMGLPDRPACISPKNFNHLVRSEVELIGSWNSFSAPYPGAAWYANVTYMSSGQLQTRSIITHRFPMAQADAAYRLIAQGDPHTIKVVLLNEP